MHDVLVVVAVVALTVVGGDVAVGEDPVVLAAEAADAVDAALFAVATVVELVVEPATVSDVASRNSLSLALAQGLQAYP